MLTVATAGAVVVAVCAFGAIVIGRRRHDRKLGFLAQYDQLTGLVNRTLFRDRLGNALARARRDGGLVSVLFLDIDGFKDVNDRFGHAVGDELLRQVAGRLVACLRESDSVARLGGDEFTIILEGGARVEDAGQVATKVLSAISAPYQIGTRDIIVTTSIGIAVYPLDGATIDELVKGADAAMYQAKSSGRNTYQYFTRALRDRTTDRLSLIEDLRGALRSGDQLRLEYQPKVDVSRGKVIGLEALVRWDHPALGLLLPEAFIHLAEETDLILPMSDWVLEEACTDMRRWLSLGLPPIRVSVNISDRLFRDANLVESVALALATTDLEPRYLEVEVTEQAIMREAERASRIVERLSDMRVKVSIDHFGTGASSIRQLEALPVSTLKIDASFVREAHRCPDSVRIAKAVISIAESFGLDVIADGVEVAEELSVMRSIGCNKIQGFLVAHALQPKDVVAFVDAYDTTLSFPVEAS